MSTEALLDAEGWFDESADLETKLKDTEMAIDCTTLMVAMYDAPSLRAQLSSFRARRKRLLEEIEKVKPKVADSSGDAPKK